MPRRRTIVIAAVVAAALLVAGGGGGYLVWKGGENARLQRTLAEKLAASLASGTIVDAYFHATPGTAPSVEYATIVKGMGGIKPAVTVTGVKPGSDARYADAALHYVWTPSPTQEPWAYDVTVPLQLTADGWLASWSASAVAPDLKDTERLLVNRLAPARGSILGSGGTPLAFNQPAIRVGIDKSRLDAAAVDPAARALAAALTAAGTAVNADTYAGKVAAAGAKAFVEAAVLRVKDPKQAAAAAAVKSLPGVNSLQVTRALGLSSSFLRPILGQVGEASADAVAASGGKIVAGDLVGTGGLQLARDEVLRGSAGYVVQAILREGSQARDLKRVVAVDGKDVTTTIDARLQTAAESILANTTPASAIVAIRPSDGAVLTIASGPGSDGVASTATQALYEPGSTFKTVSGLAMIRHGLTPTSTLECPASITIDGYTFNNDDGYPSSALGSIPWTTAFAHSCNTAVLGQAATVTQAELVSAAAGLGLTQSVPAGVIGTTSRVPAEASSATEHAASLIGQGKVLTTPFGMANVAASIGKGGLVTPVFLTGDAAAPPASGSPSAAASAAPAPANPITAAEAEYLRTLMRGVVTEGTASSALAGTPGGEIMAKTGTATFMVNGTQHWHTWLIAIQGDLAVSVLVADGDFGATTCGPLLKAFLTAVNAG